MRKALLVLAVLSALVVADVQVEDSLVVNDLVVRGFIRGLATGWIFNADGVANIDSLHVRAMTQDDKWGVFAYLLAKDTTTCASADTWYFIEGAFVNPVAEGFNVTPAGIISARSDTVTAEVDWHATLKVSPPGAIVHIGVGLNDSIVTGSVMGTFTSTIQFNMGGTGVLQVAPGDTVSLQVKSDAPGDLVIFDSFTTTIRNFFH